MKKFLTFLLLGVFLLSACGQVDVGETTTVTDPLSTENPVRIWVRTMEENYDHTRQQRSSTSFSYTEAGEYLLRVATQDGEELSRSEYEYNETGKIAKYTYSVKGVVKQITQHQYGADTYSITYTNYNEDGKEIYRYIESFANDGTWSETVFYDGDQEEARKSIKYDDKGNCIALYDYENGVEIGLTTYAYDDFGNNILTAFEQYGEVLYRTTHTYDENNHLIESRTIQDGSEEYSTHIYDANGNRIKTYECSGGDPVLAYSYTYDENNKLLEVTSYFEEESLQTISYTYDEKGNILEQRRYYAEDDSDVIERFEYDQNNNCVAHHTFIGDVKQCSVYKVFDENNNLLQIEEVSRAGLVKSKITYAYNGNRLIKKESFTAGKPDVTTEITWAEMVVTEEKAKELYDSNGNEGDYRFEEAFLEKLENVLTTE